MTRVSTPPVREPDKADPVMIGLAVEAGDWPDEERLAALAGRTLAAACSELGWPAGRNAEISLLFSDDARIAKLNMAWRGKPGPTNVLSFPSGFRPEGQPGPAVLGDIALAAETVRREAVLESKPFEHHLSHLLVHGFLHLCGHDHLNDDEAAEMEALEIRILARLDIPDPYAVSGSR